MKKRCTLLAFCLAVVNLAAAQPTFFKQYRSDSLLVWAGLSPGNDGESMVALATNFTAAILCKLDSNGDVIWGKAFRDPAPENLFFIIGDIITTPDGSIVAVASQTDSGPGLRNSVVLKLSPGGNLLWAYRIPDVVSGTDYELDVEGNDILVSTSFNRSGFYLARLDEEGQPLWAKQYQIPGYEDYYGCGAVFVPNGEILLRGGVKPARNSDFGNSVRMKVDALSGVVIQASILEYHYINSIDFDEMGNRYESFRFYTNEVFGPPQYAKYDPEGRPVWCKQLAGLSDNRLLAGYFDLANGYLDFLFSYITESESYAFRLAQTDGSLIWSKVYLGAHYASLGSNASFIARPDGGMAWLGTSGNPTAMAITQVDAEGEVEGCITHSPCALTIEDAPFPDVMPVAWAEEEYPAYEPIALLEENFLVRDSQYCHEPWFAADFTATSPVCAGDTVQVRRQETGLDFTSEWAFEGGAPASSGQPADTIRYEAPGSYTIRHIAGAFGCRDTAFTEVVVREGPVFTLGPDTSICPGARLFINSGLAAGQYQLEWQDGSASPALEAEEPGAYVLTATGATGCTRSDTLILSLHPLPEVELGPDTTLCGGASLEVTAQTGASEPLYLWSTGAALPRLTVSAEDNYVLTVTDAATGCAGQDSIRVSFAPPLLLLPLPDTSVCPGRPILLDVRALDGAPLSVQWQDGSTDNPYPITAPGAYQALVSNGACDTTLTFSIPAGDCRPGIYLPNAFSPNGDGRNDVFQPYGPDIEITELQVFSRWGALLYEGQGPGARWDGSAFGKTAPAGIYVYKAAYRRLPGEAMEVVSGEVLLVR
ncbi:MAG: gliding motility-associated C-terminal domain-containing protein [Lewinellaceae bacterium]|nr:gliding motility-associated C-terminal domain-containing protein [Lewinellaceae bacterium]